jgi:predicted PurR-regulated permease PerM
VSDAPEQGSEQNVPVEQGAGRSWAEVDPEWAGAPAGAAFTWAAFPARNARRTTVIVLLLVVLLGVAVWAFQSASAFLFLILLAWLLSIAMEPIVLWMGRRGIKRGLASGLTMLAGFLVVAGLAELFGAVFAAQLADLGQQLPAAAAKGIDWVNETFHTSFSIDQLKQQLTGENIGNLVSHYGTGLLGVFGSALALIFDTLTVLVFAYYLSADSPKLRQTIGGWLAPRYQQVFQTVWTISVEKTGGYVISKLVLAGLSATFHIAFFWIINVPFWLPLGILAGVIGQFIPTIGTYIGILVPALFSLLNKPINVLWIVIFATIYQQVENYVFTPRVSRRTMDIHPAIALASVILGAALMGPVGALIGIPLAAAALAIIDTYSKRHDLVPELEALDSAEPEEAE